MSTHLNILLSVYEDPFLYSMKEIHHLYHDFKKEAKKVSVKQAYEMYKTQQSLDALVLYAWTLGEKSIESKLQAHKLFMRALEQNEGNSFLYFCLGRIASSAQDKLQAYTQSIVLCPERSLAYNNRGNVYKTECNDMGKALADYSKAIELDSSYGFALLNRGHLYKNVLKEPQLALEDYTRTIEVSTGKDAAAAYFSRANLYKNELNDKVKALEDYNDAVRLDPNDSDIYNNRGNLYRNHFEDYEAALKDYTRAIAVNPNNGNAYFNRASIYSNHFKRYEKAKDDYLESMRCNPEDSDVYFNLGWLYEEVFHNVEKALEYYTLAIEKRQEDDASDYYHNRAILYHNSLDEPEKALEDYNKAIEISPQDPVLYNNRGVCYEDKLSQFILALADYQHALELRADYTQAQTNIKLVMTKINAQTHIEPAYDLTTSTAILHQQSSTPQSPNDIAISINDSSSFEADTESLRDQLFYLPRNMKKEKKWYQDADFIKLCIMLGGYLRENCRHCWDLAVLESIPQQEDSTHAVATVISTTFLHKVTALLTLMVITYFFSELVVGIVGNSLALLADAFHMLSDAISLFIGASALLLAKKRGTAKYSYGFGRAETLGGLINSVFLLSAVLFIGLEAVERFGKPTFIEDPWLVLGVGTGGLLINIIGMIMFCGHAHGGHGHSHGGGGGHSHASHAGEEEHGHSHHEHAHSGKKARSHNMLGVFLHVFGDFLGSIGVLIAAALTLIFVHGKDEVTKETHAWVKYVDPTLSVIMAILILITAVPLVIATSKVLLQSVPDAVDITRLREDLSKLSGVFGVHELHVWSVSHGKKLIGSVHLTLEDTYDMRRWEDLALEAKDVFHRFGIHSTTIQPERLAHSMLKRDDVTIKGDFCGHTCPTDDCAEDWCCPPAEVSMPEELQNKVQRERNIRIRKGKAHSQPPAPVDGFEMDELDNEVHSAGHSPRSNGHGHSHGGGSSNGHSHSHGSSHGHSHSHGHGSH